MLRSGVGVDMVVKDEFTGFPDVVGARGIDVLIWMIRDGWGRLCGNEVRPCSATWGANGGTSMRRVELR